MSEPIRCFLLEPTDRAKVWLRRYTKSQWVEDPERPGFAIETNREARRCPLMPGVGSYHDARVQIEDLSIEPSPEFHDCFRLAGDAHVADYMADPRWPEACGCGYRFCDCGDPACIVDAYQLSWDAIWLRTDTGEPTTMKEAPPGAMCFADWMGEHNRGPDGHCLAVKTPAGRYWMVDGPATGCPSHDTRTGHRCWTRSGTPPDVTATPSIGQQNPDGSWQYHGWLREGYLVEA